jgi:hypothetical protein
MFSEGDQVPCVDSFGSFTTGCGGLPGDSGQGIGVFYDATVTCYFNFQSQASICFAANNRGPNLQPGLDLTTTYCYDPKKLMTQHHFNVPASPNGSETFDTYIDANNSIEQGFSVLAPFATESLVPWGLPPEHPGIPNSTSHVQIFANVAVPGIPFIKVPIYSGYALRNHTDSICKFSF